MDRIKNLALVIFIIIFPLIVINLIFLIANYMTLPGDLAKIEQLRKDVNHTSSINNEDILGQVTQWNQEIESKKSYARIWWSKYAIPGEWNNVKVIDISNNRIENEQ